MGSAGPMGWATSWGPRAINVSDFSACLEMAGDVWGGHPARGAPLQAVETRRSHAASLLLLRR